MTLLSRVLSFFPIFHALLSFAAFILSLVYAVRGDLGIAAGWGIGSIVILYLFPVAVFRLHSRFFPIEEGFSNLSERVYSPWWGSHQIQLLFIAIPTAESMLRLIPGCYSAWLRLWGAQIGKNIYWTPFAEIVDRSLLTISHNVIFGHAVSVCAHVVIRNKDSTRLYVKKILIGENSLIAAQSKLGPGSIVKPGATLTYGTTLTLNQSYPPTEVAAGETS